MISYGGDTYEVIGVPKAGGILIVGDHASNYVPDEFVVGRRPTWQGEIPLGFAIRPHYLDLHIASDIGVKPVAEALVASGAVDAAFLATVSRLVVDLNRDPKSFDVIPMVSDGYPIRKMEHRREDAIDEAMLLRSFHKPCHDDLSALLASHRPAMILSLHSFTPVLLTEPEAARPWHVGILYNEDDRLARAAMPALEIYGLNVGDQLPYSGKDLNYTMNRHAEGNGIPYLGIEMRQDLVADADGVARMASWIQVALKTCRNELA